MSQISTASTVASLRRDVAALAKGDKVRVVFTDGVDAVGTLEGWRSDPNLLLLKISADPAVYRVVRGMYGDAGLFIATFEAWDEDARFDRLMADAQDWAQLQDEAQHCPKSEQGWRQLKAEEAKQAFIDEWLATGGVR